ncbi:hypothetical protein [Streptomyces sp. NPDC007205]|uniref:hypothetical protein n=1 Tax=Streptomyces sp. NPDC007205 TaxID=3154316 RepID=UPI0033E576BC
MITYAFIREQAPGLLERRPEPSWTNGSPLSPAGTLMRRMFLGQTLMGALLSAQLNAVPSAASKVHQIMVS